MSRNAAQITTTAENVRTRIPAGVPPRAAQPHNDLARKTNHSCFDNMHLL